MSDQELTVPGATLRYDVRGAGPVLLLMGTPMDATGFAALAPLLERDHTVVTYDPRGIARSSVDDRTAQVTPEQLADDLSRLLAAVTDEPAAVLGSSGGAIAGLALVTAHPEQVSVLVAHEPPVTALLPDAAERRADLDGIYELYRDEGVWPAMGRFLEVIGIETPTSTEPLPMELTEAIARDTGFFLANLLRTVSLWQPDLDVLRASSTRIVIGVGATSKGQFANRTALALAERLGVTPVEFPGDHGGFAGEPADFADVLRGVLQNATDQYPAVR